MGDHGQRQVLAQAHTLYVVPAEKTHIDSLIADIRTEDRQEWLRFAGVPLRPALEWCTENCLTLSTVHPDGQCVCICGVQSWNDEDPSRGLLFLAGANRGYDHAADFTYLSRKVLELLHMRHSRLEAFVEIHNERHIHWLDAVGFRFLDVVECGAGRWPFYHVEHVAHHERTP